MEKDLPEKEKYLLLFISKDDMNDILKIIKSLEDSDVLIDWVTETVKDEIKKTRRWISSSFVSTLSHFFSVPSNFFSSKRYKWKRSGRAGRRWKIA